MTRVSTGMMNNDIQNNLRLQESRQNRINGQLSSQQRLQSLREDPLAAGHLVRYQSYLGRVQTFEKNAQVLTDRFSLTGNNAPCEGIGCSRSYRNIHSR